MATAQAAVSTAPQMSPQQQNAYIRNLWKRGGPVGKNYFPPATEMSQQLPVSVPANIAPGGTMSVQLKNVGLIKKVIVEFKATVTASAQQQNLTALGLQNLFSNVNFIDLAGNTRINTPSAHINMLQSVKHRRIYGAAYTTDTPNGMGNNFNRTMFAPATIAANGNTEIDFMLEIPFAYSEDDWSGIIYGDTTQAVMTLNLTLNPNMFVASGADATFAVYQSAGANIATLSNVSWTVNQVYMAQGPMQQPGVPLLPFLDIGTAYLLNNTASGLPIANQQNATPFVNQRKFMSLIMIYDNNGVLNTGTDIQQLGIASATFTFIDQADPKLMSLRTRKMLGADLPAGTYYWDFRKNPIDTDQFGNMQVLITPSSVGGANAFMSFYWESLAIIGQVNQAGALPSGGGM